ncbi:uncharacterized protein [Prorops nasuta]|uniref:uncharacterized protein n=1 Tax=Prorops nasuta TaxID=863751 RepID=UPI0034CE4EDA
MHSLKTFCTVLIAIFSVGQAIPVTYDQRQEGTFNWVSDFKNILFVVAPPINTHTDIVHEIVNQALELKNLASSRHANSQPEVENDHDHLVRNPALAERKNNEPYRVEIVHIGKDEDTKEPKLEIIEESNKNRMKIIPSVSVLKDPEVKSRDSATIKPEVDVKKLDIEIEKKKSNKENISVVVHRQKRGDRSLWRNTNEQYKLGSSLKKELSRGNLAKKKDSEFHELKLIGDGIENCGPGRHRDSAGICQPDSSKEFQ